MKKTFEPNVKTLLLSAAVISALGMGACSTVHTTDAMKSTAVQTQNTYAHTDSLDKFMASSVAAGRVAGVSALIYKNGQEVYFGKAGHRDIDAGLVIDRSDVGRYYSMTKPIVGVALMTLFEDGKFKLDDPVSKFLPEFKDMKTFVGVNADKSMKLVPASREITIRDLMRHTAGFTYGSFSNTPVDQAYRKAGILRPDKNTDHFSKSLAALPLLVQPGTKWIYSVGVDVQGRLIEVLSGKKLGDYLQKEIFNPLKMSHTGFNVKKADHDKFSPVYIMDPRSKTPKLFKLTDQNSLKATNGLTRNIDSNFLSPPVFQGGGGGLVSTIDDYSQFTKMLLGDGKSGRTRILKKSTLDIMSSDHLGSIDNGSLDETLGFGLDFAVKIKSEGKNDGYKIPVGSYFWGGLAGTFFWIDPSNDQFAILHMQLINPTDPSLRADFTKAVYGK